MPKTKATTKTKRDLPVVLTDIERLNYGRKLANYQHELDTIDIEKKAAVESFKDRASEVAVQVRRLVSAIRDGIEEREIECEWVYMWPTFTKQLVRCDTGEIIETEMITADERQLGLDGIDNN